MNARVWFVSVAALGLCACELATCRSSPPHVIVIVIDALRRDRLGVYGSARSFTPFIDSLAARGVVFERAYAQSSWTKASIASLLTSRYPSQHGVDRISGPLGEEEVTLPEVLQQHRYATGGFSANVLLHPKFGFAQGYDGYYGEARKDPLRRWGSQFTKQTSERINNLALRWLTDVAAKRKPLPPTFLYLHYMETHPPYDPPEPFIDRVLADTQRSRPEKAAVNVAMRNGDISIIGTDTLQQAQDLYAAELLHLDGQLRELFNALAARAFLQRAVVIITADHGEEFGEHGLIGHHQSLYETVIRVPLIILVPGRDARADVSDVVSLTDVAPTVLDLAGIPIPDRFEGRSLRRYLEPRSWWQRIVPGTRGEDREENVAYSQLFKPDLKSRTSPHEEAVVLNSAKLITGVYGERELYDLDKDPGETQPATVLDDAIRSRLDEQLEQLHRLAPARPEGAHTAAIDARTQEQMRALGYADTD